METVSGIKSRFKETTSEGPAVVKVRFPELELTVLIESVVASNVVVKTVAQRVPELPKFKVLLVLGRTVRCDITEFPAVTVVNVRSDAVPALT